MTSYSARLARPHCAKESNSCRISSKEMKSIRSFVSLLNTRPIYSSFGFKTIHHAFHLCGARSTNSRRGLLAVFSGPTEDVCGDNIGDDGTGLAIIKRIVAAENNLVAELSHLIRSSA